jgi:hypothetical protein
MVDDGTTSGTKKVNSRPEPRPRSAAHQNNACQLKCSAMTADSGRPNAPPTPSEALTIPIAPPTRSAGNEARSTLMPSGITGAPNPCNARPMTSGIRELVSAATTDPTVSSTAQATSTRLAPNMSPSLPNIGVATAPVSSVAVTAHEALADEVPRMSGSCGTSGMTSVCIKETLMPARASTAMSVAPPLGGAGRSTI